jgi:hypothetical protein
MRTNKKAAKAKQPAKPKQEKMKTAKAPKVPTAAATKVWSEAAGRTAERKFAKVIFNQMAKRNANASRR